jgi:anti-sigma regulatory factor (Ser/Thr protein kinase)
MRHFFFYEIRNQPSALQQLTQKLESTFLCEIGAPDVRTTVLLVVDELVSNLLKYGFGSGPDQRSYLTIAFDNDLLEIEFKDNGRRFNPLVQPEPELLGRGLQDRSMGGLGVYLVLKTMDETHYEWIDPWNCLKLRKKLKRAWNDREN